MTNAELEELLESSLADNALSRSERKSLIDGLTQLSAGGPAARNLTRQTAFALAARRLDQGAEIAAVLAWLEDVVKVIMNPNENPVAAQASSEAYFSPGDECTRRILSLIADAQKSMDIAVFTITDDRITDAIIRSQNTGKVAVRIVTDDEKAFDLGSDIERLAQAGVPVRVDRTPHHMHHKFAVFDGNRLLNGSFNWTRSAANHNEENVIVLSDPKLVTIFQRNFEDLWDSSKPFDFPQARSASE